MEGALGLFIPMKGPGLLALAMSAKGGGSALPQPKEGVGSSSLALLHVVAPQVEIGGEEFRVAQEADPCLQPLRHLAAG